MASLVLVGEAPGVEEDASGRPFVGAAGQLLDALLRRAGLDPAEDVFITNVVGCRPPGNRPPRPGEIRACSERLESTLGVVEPGCLVLLGRVPASLKFPRVPLGKVRGSIFELDGRSAVATFHPSYLLRTGGTASPYCSTMVADLKLGARTARRKKRIAAERNSL